MKKLINGKLYDTKTAEQIAVDCNELEFSTPNYYEETLFKTSEGDYFFYGVHGPDFDFTLNPKWVNTEGKDIIECSFQDADEWLGMILEKIREIIAELKSGQTGQKTINMK